MRAEVPIALASRELEPPGLEVRRPTLEDVYLSLTGMEPE